MTLADGMTSDDGTVPDVQEAGDAPSCSTDGGCAVAIAAGADHTCALTAGGTVRCWGANGSGQLGNDSITESNVPVAVSGLGSGVTAIAAGYYHTCAVTRGGGAQCWGDNVYGEIGDNTNDERNVPTSVLGLGSGSGVTAIAPGGNHTCALSNDVSVHCWGLGTSGQLGDDSTDISLAPVLTLPPGDSVSAVLAIATGGFHSCALTTDRGVRCWGDNTYGELGNDSTSNSSVPVAVLGLESGVTAIAAGWSHTCATTRVGTVQCWGDNEDGQLGNDSTTSSSVPVTVVGFGSIRAGPCRG